MIVGSGFGNDEPVWPLFGFEFGCYCFYLASDDDKPLSKIADFDFEHWLNWLYSTKFEAHLQDFVDDTKRIEPKKFGDIVNRLMWHGCKESRDSFEWIMNLYYEEALN